ncbi:MAG: ABC transporter permease [Solirubrobacteraceae bacterium]
MSTPAVLARGGSRSRARDMLRMPRSRGVERAALYGLAAITLLSLLAGLLAPHGASQILPAGALKAPSAQAWFGTDEVGRDIFSRVLIGVRESWFSALAVIAGGAAFGALVGALAGAAGGLVDALLMRITDLFLALPAPILAIAVVSSLGPSLVHSLLALSIVWWPWYARIVRGEVRAMAARPHADAARIAGVSRCRLIRRHLLPGVLRPVVVTMSLDVGNLVLALSALSFIGLGAPAPSPELGSMSARGLDYLLGQPWVPLFPAFAVALLAFTSNLAGDGLARLLDPRERTSR